MHHRFYIILVSLAVGVSFLPYAAKTAWTSNESPLEISEPDQLDDLLPPILLRIAICESRNRQFKPDGSLVRGRINPLDIGRFQINERWHLKEARRLGFDIYTQHGNTAYALYLYNLRGTRDWNWSKSCWSQSTTA